MQTIASFLYHFFYIPYSVFKKEVLSLPAKVSNKIKDDGKQKAWLCLRHNRASFFYCILYKSCVQISDAGSIQEFPVFSYSIRNLAYFDEFIG